MTKTATRKVNRKHAAKRACNAPAAKKPAMKYACGTCGLVVSVDNECGCMETHELACCGRVMRPRK